MVRRTTDIAPGRYAGVTLSAGPGETLAGNWRWSAKAKCGIWRSAGLRRQDGSADLTPIWRTRHPLTPSGTHVCGMRRCTIVVDWVDEGCAASSAYVRQVRDRGVGVVGEIFVFVDAVGLFADPHEALGSNVTGLQQAGGVSSAGLVVGARGLGFGVLHVVGDDVTHHLHRDRAVHHIAGVSASDAPLVRPGTTLKSPSRPANADAYPTTGRPGTPAAAPRSRTLERTPGAPPTRSTPS